MFSVGTQMESRQRASMSLLLVKSFLLEKLLKSTPERFIGVVVL